MVRTAIFISMLVFGFVTLPLSAQSLDYQYTADKNDNRFTSQLGLYISSEHSTFMKSAELSLEWWGLSGGPVYYYKFRWQIKDDINFIHSKEGLVSLDRGLVQKYPELLARFNDLRPTSIEIEFDVELRRDLQNNFFVEDEKNGLSELSYFAFDSFSYTKTLRHVPHIMIGKSGKLGDNISPGSPRNYRSFIDQPNWQGAGDSLEETEKKLSNTFKDTGSINFIRPQITKLILPVRELQAIWDAYQKLEEEEAEEAEEEEAEDFLDDDPELADTPEKSNSAEADDDNFLDEDPNVTSVQNSDDDFLNDMPDERALSRFGISEESTITEGESRTRGVTSAGGAILIPYRRWNILSYKSGIAEVIRRSDTQDNNKAVTCASVSNSVFGSLNTFVVTYTFERGLVDSAGNWLTPPQKWASTGVQGYSVYCTEQIEGDIQSDLISKGYKLTNELEFEQASEFVDAP